MRKIETKEIIEKKQKKKQLILGIILISLLTLSTAGYSIMNNKSQGNSIVQDNGIKFYQQNGFWIAETADQKFVFQNLPSEVDDISIETNMTLGSYYGSVVYFNQISDGAIEILTNINDFILRYQEACVKNETCEGDLPTKNCDDNLIIFVDNPEETKVYQEGNCIYISGDQSCGADAFLYKILGIN